MRALVLFLSGVGLMLAPAAAQPEGLGRAFEAGNEAYRQGQYEQAATRYRGILDRGYASAALYHNLGNAYVRLDRVGAAIRYYEKGRRLRPDDLRLQHNLAHVRRQEGLSLGGFPARGLAAVFEAGSPLALFLTGWVVMSAGLIVLLFGARLPVGPVWRRSLGWGIGGVGLVLLLVALGTSYAQSQVQHAVVVGGQMSIRSTPEETAPADTTVGAGTLVRVRDQRDGWAHVRLADRTAGWVPADVLGDI